MNKIEIKKLKPSANVWTKEGNTLYLYANSVDYSDYKMHKIIKVRTGISLNIIDPTIMGLIFSLEGLASEYGIRLANGIQTIDASKNDQEIVITLRKDLYTIEKEIKKGRNIAKVVFLQAIMPEFEFIEYGQNNT